MQFSLERLFEMIEQRLGRGVSTGLLILVAVAVAVLCGAFIWDKAIWPIVGLVKGTRLPPVSWYNLLVYGGVILATSWSIFYTAALLYHRVWGRKAGITGTLQAKKIKGDKAIPKAHETPPNLIPSEVDGVSHKDEWLHELLRQEHKNPGRGLRVQREGIEWSKFKEHSPYIAFKWDVFNALLYDALVQAGEIGHVRLNGIELQRQLEITEGDNAELTRSSGLRHAFGSQLTARQWLSPEEKQHILQRHGQEVEFSFGDVRIHVQCIALDGSRGPDLPRFPLPVIWKCTVPDLVELVRSS